MALGAGRDDQLVSSISEPPKLLTSFALPAPRIARGFALRAFPKPTVQSNVGHMFIDEAIIRIKAGNGGAAGRASSRAGYWSPGGGAGAQWGAGDGAAVASSGARATACD